MIPHDLPFDYCVKTHGSKAGFLSNVMMRTFDYCVKTRRLKAPNCTPDTSTYEDVAFSSFQLVFRQMAGQSFALETLFSEHLFSPVFSVSLGLVVDVL